jgi:hypothetical protein
MAHVFTSIAYAVERLHECEYFLGRLADSRSDAFSFELNAFLSASRSVTFVLQKSMAHVPNFDPWYQQRRLQMAADPAMRFFLELRNVSQKQGPISYVGGAVGRGKWSYQFVSGVIAMPKELFGRDIVECCAEQLKKLAQLLLSYYEAYPADACVGCAWTEEGMSRLGFSLADVASCLGLPLGYLEVGGDSFSIEDRFRVLRREIDPIDKKDLERLSAGEFMANGTPISLPVVSSDDFVTHVARIAESRSGTPTDARSLFLQAIAERILEQEKD